MLASAVIRLIRSCLVLAGAPWAGAAPYNLSICRFSVCMLLKCRLRLADGRTVLAWQAIFPQSPGRHPAGSQSLRPAGLSSMVDSALGHFIPAKQNGPAQTKRAIRCGSPVSPTPRVWSADQREDRITGISTTRVELTRPIARRNRAGGNSPLSPPESALIPL